MKTMTSSVHQDRSILTHVERILVNQRCLFLLIALIALLLIYPYMIDTDEEASVVLLVLSTAVFLAGMYAIARQTWHWLLGSCLLVPALIGNWLHMEYTATVAGFVLMSAESAFYLFAIILLLAYVFHERGQLVDKLYAALCAYLLIGQMFFSLFVMLETFYPGSIQASDGNFVYWYDLMFFSYVTLTTLGYGDITPVSAQAQALASLEAIIGVFYLAVMVAWLVGSLNGIKVESEQQMVRE